MRAVACKQAELSVVDRDPPTPGKGQLLINVTRCGICGSDLHARRHADELADVAAEIGSAPAGELAPTGREVAGDHVANAVGLEHADHRQPDRTAPDHDRDLTLGDLAAADRVPGYRHRLGQRGEGGLQAVGDRERKRLFDQQLLGIRARGVGG